MATKTSGYRCTECNQGHLKWVGQCSNCKQWGTVAEATTGPVAPGQIKVPARPATDLANEPVHVTPTGVAEFDRILGGGLVPGGVILLAGEPGAGKSTLLLDVAHRFGHPNAPALMISGEETARQIGLRANRIGAVNPDLLVAAEDELPAVVAHIEQHNPGLVILDSLQAFRDPGIDGDAGKPAQLMHVATVLTRLAKTRECPTILVGQFTKTSEVQGPQALAHLIDVIVLFEGDRVSPLRVLRTTKNRWGAADEVALFEQTENGVRAVTDPAGWFVTQRETPSPGSVVGAAMEGRRSLSIEVQALVCPTPNGGSARRTCTGIETNRVAMILAILDRHADSRLSNRDVYVSTVGGLKVSDPGMDLAVLLSLWSAATNAPAPPHLAAIGETSLTGDVRPTRFIPQRVAELARRGFTKVIAPPGAIGECRHIEGVTVVETATVEQATNALTQLSLRAPAATAPAA